MVVNLFIILRKPFQGWNNLRPVVADSRWSSCSVPGTRQGVAPVMEPALHKGGRQVMCQWTDRGPCTGLLPATLGVGFVLVASFTEHL